MTAFASTVVCLYLMVMSFTHRRKAQQIFPLRIWEVHCPSVNHRLYGTFSVNRLLGTTLLDLKYYFTGQTELPLVLFLTSAKNWNKWCPCAGLLVTKCPKLQPKMNSWWSVLLTQHWFISWGVTGQSKVNKCTIAKIQRKPEISVENLMKYSSEWFWEHKSVWLPKSKIQRNEGWPQTFAKYLFFFNAV